MSIPGEAPVFDPTDWLPIDEENLKKVVRHVDNAVNLPGAIPTITRRASWQLGRFQIGVEVCQDFVATEYENPAFDVQFGLSLNPVEEDDFSEESPSFDLSFSDRRGIRAEINGHKIYEERLLQELFLFAGDMVKELIRVQVFSDGKKVIAPRLGKLANEMNDLLEGDEDDMLLTYNWLRRTESTRHEASLSLPGEIMLFLKKARLGVLIVEERIHLGLINEDDCTLRRYVESHLLGSSTISRGYHSVITPSGLNPYYEGKTLFSSSSAFCVLDNLTAKISSEECPQYVLELLDNDIHPMSVLEPVSQPLPQTLVRDATNGDYRRIEPELVSLSQKYGI
ncbi:MAG TPA: hypothetical protein VFN31_01495 [Candidatus Saccharimonadales bacterium]|nr:hypothetical protein [Candidatus Saccharimonadales bacterium]